MIFDCFFFQAEDGIRDRDVTGVQTCALPISGIALPLTRTIGTVWVNRQTSGETRATVHSFLAQAEYVGEIVCEFGIAAVARFAGLSLALVACGALFGVAIVLVRRLGVSQTARAS